MFTGRMSGKGAVPSYVKKVHDIIAVDDEMVKETETGRKKMSAEELKVFKDGIMPFEAEGKWRMGLSWLSRIKEARKR